MIHAATGVVDITPDYGVDLSGYVARDGAAAGVLDSLGARALCLDDGATRALLVSSDVLAIGRNFADEVRKEIGERLETSAENVILAATHTHSAPAISPLRGCGKVDAAWVERFRRAIVEAAEQAVEGMKQVEVRCAFFQSNVGRNRRVKEGEIDSEGAVVQFVIDRMETIATLLIYGCHPVALTADNLLVSSDYPGVVRQILEGTYGGTSIFLNGAGGDVDPVVRGSVGAMRRIGKVLAKDALVALERTESLSGNIEVRRRTIEIPSEPLPSMEELEKERCRFVKQAKTARSDVERRIARVFLDWADETLQVRKRHIERITFSLLITLFKIGELTVVFLSGEPFSGLGKKIKRELSPRRAIVVGYADDCLGYLPDAQAYAVEGYEVATAHRYFGRLAAVGREAESLILSAVLGLAGTSEC